MVEEAPERFFMELHSMTQLQTVQVSTRPIGVFAYSILYGSPEALLSEFRDD